MRVGRGIDLRGAVAVVTGASSGIGWSAAWALAAGGATVVAAARREDRLAHLVGQIEQRGGRALAVGCDVTDRAQVEALRDRTLGAFGRADVLVSNAGIPGGGEFARMPVEHVERVVATNLLGVLYGARAFLPAMLEAGRGHVVNVASLAGRFAIPGQSVYGATKHAVIGFSESLNYETSPRGVLVTAVNPGFTSTEAFPQTELIERGIPVMAPRDVARVIVRVVRRGDAPEASIPRWISALQAVRTLAPRPYRAAVRTVVGAGGYRPTERPEGGPAGR